MLDIILFKIRRKDKSKSYYIRNTREDNFIYLKINNRKQPCPSYFLSQSPPIQACKLKDNETQSGD